MAQLLTRALGAVVAIVLAAPLALAETRFTVPVE